MKKILFGFLLLAVGCKSNKAHDASRLSKKEEIMFPFNGSAITWKNIEKKNDAVKANFKKLVRSLLPSEYALYTQDSEFNSEKTFDDSCHIVDFNNDGRDDIVYTGSSGGEGTEVVIFMNTGNSFKPVLKQVERIVKIEFKKRKLYRLYMQDTGCCDAWIDFNRIYQVEYNNDTPTFHTIYLSSNMHIARFPSKYLDKPILFEVLHDNYKMHLEPRLEDTIIDDFTFPDHSFKTENVIDTLKKGTKGRAIAAQTDKAGRIWWLVEIDSAYKGYGNLFYEQAGDTVNKASKIGWISSRYTKRIAR